MGSEFPWTSRWEQIHAGVPMKSFVTFFLLLLLASFSCKDIGDNYREPSLTPPPPPPPVDTVRFEFRLDGLKETYTLDDTIQGAMIAINRASAHPLCFSAGGYPPYHWFVRRVGRTDYDFFYPRLISLVMYNDTLRLGDTLSFRIFWIQQAYPSNVRNPDADKQKAFAGRYEFCAHLPTSDLFEDISFPRTLTITEQGEVLSAVLTSMSFLNDTIDVGLAVRNRVSRSLDYLIDDPFPVKVSVAVGPDTVLKRSYALPFSTLSLPPLSDNMPYRFQRAEHDTIFAGMRGSYNMSVSLKLRDHEITASRTIGIYP
jgi:hypothetical protein